MTWSRLRELIAALTADERGAAAIEYGLIAAGIFLAIAVVVYELGDTVLESYQSVDEGLDR